MKTMNKYMLGWAFVGTLAMMTACSDDNSSAPEPEPVVPSYETITSEAEGEPPTFSFTSAGNSMKLLSFKTNQKWRIELVKDQEGADYDWLTIFDREGEGKEEMQRVWIAAAKNDDYDSRSAEFKLIVPNGDKDSIQTFRVYQAQQDAFLVTDPKAFMNLPADGKTGVSLEFQHNVENYEISVSSKDWMEVTDEAPSQSRALKTVYKYVNISPNNLSFSVRTGTITIKDKDKTSSKGAETVTIPVIQYGLAKPVITVNNAEQLAAIPAAESAIDLDLTTENVVSICDNLTIDIPEYAKDWLSFVKNEEGTGYVIKTTKNDGGIRFAECTICPKIDHTVTYPLNITQQGADGITVSIINKYEFTKNLSQFGGNFNVKYFTNEKDWKYAIETPDGEPVDWIHVNSMATPGQIEVSYDQNQTYRTRTAVFMVYPEGKKDKADKITLIQNPKTQVEIVGGLNNTLEKLVEDAGYNSVKDITSLELKGALTRSELDVLANMLKGKVGNESGYKLNSIDLAEVTLEKNNMPGNQFKGCTQLKSIVFPKSMREMGERVCQDCNNLVSAKFNEGITYLCNHAFNNCSKLQEVWIPSTVSYIYGSVFEKCTSLTKIHLQCLPILRINVGRSPTQPTSRAEPFFNAGDVAKKKYTLYVPTAYVEYYKTPDPQHVACLYDNVKELLQTLKPNSAEWVTGNKNCNIDWHPNASALRTDFSWYSKDNTKIVAEDKWADNKE